MKISNYYEGMVWLDNDKNKSTLDKIREGLDYYIQKFGHKPDAIFTMKEEINEIKKSDLNLQGVPIMDDEHSMKSHYWYCIKEKRKNNV